jgi:D-glycero-D-manno-heptose 1,7-bisphosphate phosphatase
MKLHIFDADGTLRRSREGLPCPHADGDWHLIEGVAERLHALDGPLAVASNQDHVGYGLVSGADAHRFLCEMLERASGRPPLPGAVRFCPHRLEETCACRKPAPGMLLALVRQFAASEALFVGDAPCDREAAARAGISFAWAWDFFGWRQA